MVIIHEAVLRPSEAEALAAWLPSQPWSGVTPGAAVEVVRDPRGAGGAVGLMLHGVPAGPAAAAARLAGSTA